MERTSEFNFYNYFLPKEILIFIFSFLDKRTLVFNCRPVCKFWKYVVECEHVWKIQILREAKLYSSELENILPTANLNYPWYMCYILCKNIFYKNLLPDCCSEENLTYWKDVLSRCTGLICSAPLLAHSISYGAVPKDLQDEGVTTCLLTSYGDCSLYETIKLYDCGFTRKTFEYSPPIHISEWFAVGFHFSGTCYLEVSFYDSKWRRDFQNGYFQYRRRLMNREWHNVSHTFTNYRPDVRYITVRHGVHTYLTGRSGRKRETVSYGEAAAKIAGCKLVVTMPELSKFAWYRTQ